MTPSTHPLSLTLLRRLLTVAYPLTLQVCVISGESGAGKTETAKLFVRHILLLSHSAAGDSRSLEASILAVNPLLEVSSNLTVLRCVLSDADDT